MFFPDNIMESSDAPTSTIPFDPPQFQSTEEFKKFWDERVDYHRKCLDEFREKNNKLTDEIRAKLTPEQREKFDRSPHTGFATPQVMTVQALRERRARLQKLRKGIRSIIEGENFSSVLIYIEFNLTSISARKNDNNNKDDKTSNALTKDEQQYHFGNSSLNPGNDKNE